LSHSRIATEVAGVGLLAALLTACGGAGSAPVADQSGATAQAATFVPQPAGAAAAAASGSRVDAMAQPLPEPLIALGGRRIAPDITSPIVNDSGSYTNGPIILGTNTATAGYGVEGITDGSGAGLYGHSGSGSVTSYGVYGFSPGGAGVYGYTNKTGSGVLGVAAKGNGVLGETSFPSTGTSAFQKAGVLGEDLSTDGGYNDAGVAGMSTNGYGFYGSSTNGSGAFATSYSGTGVYGVSQIGYAMAAESVGTGAAFYAAVPYGTNVAVIAQSGGLSLLTENNSSQATMSLDASGNMILLGNLTVDGTVSSSSSRNRQSAARDAGIKSRASATRSFPPGSDTSASIPISRSNWIRRNPITCFSRRTATARACT